MPIVSYPGGSYVLEDSSVRQDILNISNGLDVVSGDIIDLTRDLKPWRICATRGCFYYTGDGSGGQTRFESYIKAAICKGGVTAIRLVYANKYSGDEGEVVSLLSTYTLESSVTIAGTLIPVTFGGKKSPAVDPDTPFLISDPIGISLPEGTIIEVRTGAIIAFGGRIAVGLRSGGNATVKVRSSSAFSQIYTTSAMVTPLGGTTASNGFVPMAVLGKVVEDPASVLLLGDSQLVGIGDTSDFTTGLLGGVERAMAYCMIGFSNGSRGGDKTGTYTSKTCSSRLSLLPYVTHLYANMGINDVVAGRSASTILANIDALISICQRTRVRLVYESIFTVTTSNNSWADMSGQTVTTGFEVGGVRDQVNAGLISRTNSGLLDYIDTSSSLIDPTTNKWLPNTTDDGTHTGTNGHLIRQSVIATHAIQWHNLTDY